MKTTQKQDDKGKARKKETNYEYDGQDEISSRNLVKR